MPERKDPPSPSYLADLVRQILGPTLTDRPAGPGREISSESDDFLSPNRLAQGAWAHLTRLEQERGEAVFRVEELRDLPAEERRVRLAHDPGLHLWAVAEQLLAESNECRQAQDEAARAPGTMPTASPLSASRGAVATGAAAAGATTATLAPPKIVPPSPAAALAAEALLVLDRIDPKIYGASCVEDLYAQCHTALGLAHLAESELAGAEQELAQAYDHLEAGTGDILSRAQMLDFEAALRLAQGRFGEALSAVDRASRSFRTAHDRHFEGLAQLRRAEILRAAGRRTEAIGTCRKGLALIDLDRATIEARRARRSLVHDLAALGRHDEAAAEAARPPALAPEET
ncbi:MAG TPA: hypothetical protein VGS22_01070 [Thermoanaerobaculia bacterium]|jgi:tetratricopeptide (TPR) repeat protein|nr:hypothetical protein [Thermoanaerobaculia bacterium]